MLASDCFPPTIYIIYKIKVQKYTDYSELGEVAKAWKAVDF